MNDTLTLRGLNFKMTAEQDFYYGTPWDNEDGHGPVSEWRSANYRGTYDKRPGERKLCDDGRSYGSARFYDFAEAVKIAKREGWGINETERAKLAETLKREPKPGDIAARAVELDMRHLQRWCEGSWRYVVIGVTLLDVDGNETSESEYVGGVYWDDYTDNADADEIAREQAEQIATRVGRRKWLQDGSNKVRVRD